MDQMWKSDGGRAAKRAVDLIGAAAALVVGLPVFVVVAVVVRTSLGRPVFFIQERPGLHGAIFHMYKFRTMSEAEDSVGEPLPDDERMTAVGSLLRRWSLDELPELWNVLRGDMSLVGPRPLLMGYMDLYTDEQMRRHDMRPGLTGLAQVSGRNDQSWEERLALDIWYVGHWSFRLDAKILARTAVKVLVREGIAAEGEATMPRFEGTRNG